MANKNFVGTRLSPELKQRFDEHVESSGKKPADVIREAISSYLNFKPSLITVDIDVITDLQNRVKALEDKAKQASSSEVQLEIQREDNKSENNTDIKPDNTEKLFAGKEIAAMKDVKLTYPGLMYRHKAGKTVTLPDGRILEPVRVKDGPRWQICQDTKMPRQATKQHQHLED